MNSHDRSNLDFLMTCSDEVFDTWANTATTDDLAYALELITAHRRELADLEASLFDDVHSLDEARALLKKFQL